MSIAAHGYASTSFGRWQFARLFVLGFQRPCVTIDPALAMARVRQSWRLRVDLTIAATFMLSAEHLMESSLVVTDGKEKTQPI